MVKADSARSARLTLSPASLRTLCRAALDRGERLDPRSVARQLSPPAENSLMAASIAAIDGAHAAHDGNDIGAASRWAITLGTAVQHDYLLLACDALEALAAIARRQGRLSDARVLLAGAKSAREITGYRFRFGSSRWPSKSSAHPCRQPGSTTMPTPRPETRTSGRLLRPWPWVAREVIDLGADKAREIPRPAGSLTHMPLVGRCPVAPRRSGRPCGRRLPVHVAAGGSRN